ncbi:MAG: hypothetical protein F6K54_20220 [Okeania sp. SIO3B5]|uniref:hypothetical protein n=1 Tax=Okeania sp. SIO3B5 TaxID=2607811 RepID=UPI0014003E8F|nr:hypothetical protein [Okeania sp. SIO3B5]NEO55197.1 hypothetical protein [Okeania sp. SIO3B5]
MFREKMTEYPYQPLVLEPEQYNALFQLATQKHQTVSEVAVEVVRLGLETLKQRGDGTSDEGDREYQKALECLNSLRAEIQQTHGIYSGDLVAEVRTEREEQIERIITGEL